MERLGSSSNLVSRAGEKPFILSISLQTGGWRSGVTTCAASTAFVFLINFSVTARALTANAASPDDRPILYEGDCNQTRKYNLLVHLIINILSTILLSSSNYCMQVLCAATRKDVDIAHSRGDWLDIGIVSFRNLSRISKTRALLWWLLAISSLPLHLFYNSAVFSTISSYRSRPFFVDPAYLQIANTTGNPTLLSRPERVLAKDDLLHKLNLSECITAYANDPQTSWGDVVIVVDVGNSSDVPQMLATPHLFGAKYMDCPTDPYGWICAQDGKNSCDCSKPNLRTGVCSERAPRCKDRLQNIRSNSSGWRPFEQLPIRAVDSCYAQQLPQICRLQFSTHLAIIVLFLNLAKAIAMCTVLLAIKEAPLLTLGDAIASFFSNPDSMTEGMCLLTGADVRAGKGTCPLELMRIPRPFRSTRSRWFSAASKMRWIVSILIYLTSITLSAFFLAFALKNVALSYSAQQARLSSLLALGIGKVDSLTLISWNLPSTGTGGLILNVLVANATQPVLSFLYFAYNGLFTSMSGAQEWEGFAMKRKGLRVSAGPQGAQRSTYFLQLPYRMAIPLMCVSGLLHWLVSQSLFLVSIQSVPASIETGSGDDETTEELTCGYSPAAILAVIIVGILMVIVLMIAGFRRHKSGMPVVGSCSLAIAAACHPDPGGKEFGKEVDAALREVQWGVMGLGVDGVEHCGFSSEDVALPKEDTLYA